MDGLFEVLGLKIPIIWKLGRSHDEKIDYTIIFRLTISPEYRYVSAHKATCYPDKGFNDVTIKEARSS